MRTKASLFVALLAAVAVIIPAGSASAALSTDLSQLINAGTQTVDIVDAGGVSIAAPVVAFPTKGFSFTCQPSVTVFGTVDQKIKVTNQLAGNINVSLSAVAPLTDVWNSGTDSYAFNDEDNAGCDNGQLSVGAGTFTKTAGSGIPTQSTPGGAFTADNPVTLLNNSGTVRYEAELTGFTLTQQIPAEQAEGDYSLPMNVTYVAQ